MPGKAAYAPPTQRNVPKYFAPMTVLDMLIEKPIMHMVKPARINGNRILMRSDHIAKIISTIASNS